MKTDSHIEPSKATQSIALKTWISFLVVAGGLALFGFIYSIRHIVLQLVMGLIVALALAPFVRILTKRGVNRTLAAVISLGLTFIILLGIVGAVATPLVTQGDDLVRDTPRIVDHAANSPLFKDLNNRYDLVGKAKELSKEAPSKLSGAGSPLLGAVSSVIGVATTTGVVLILALFMLMEGPDSWKRFTQLLGRERGEWVDDVAKKITVGISGFVTGNLLISLIAGIVALITLLILDVPYAFALAVLVAIFDLIPLVGAAIATVILGLVALTQGIAVALIVVAVMLAYQTIEGHIIQPIIYARTVQLSQLLIIVASIIGAELGGIIGVLLAIPAASTLQIIVVEILKLTHVGQRANIAEASPVHSKAAKQLD